MPWPTAGLLNRPLMTLILVLIGSSGARLLLSFMFAPLPLAHQWLPLIPLPMNMTAKRWGKALAAADAALAPAPAAPAVAAVGAVVVVAPQTGIDSSHGSAMVTPTPRRNVLREKPACRMSLPSV